MTEPGRAVAARRAVTVVALLTVLALVVAGTGASAGDPILVGYGSSVRSGGPAGAIGPVADSTMAAFSISGSAKGLFPGASRPLVLVVSNHRKVAITVVSIATKVGAASHACRASNVKVSHFTGKLPVPAAGTARVTVHVTMARSAPNACQGKAFPFRYSGSATERRDG